MNKINYRQLSREGYMLTTSNNNLDIPLNFTQSFKPETGLISRLLKFVKNTDGTGTKEEIRDHTGIPTGSSSGKVEPIIYYSCGMGLLYANKQDDVWCLRLSRLGQLIAEEDINLSEPETLWIMHLLLCRRRDLNEPARGVADAWFTLFADSEHRLGKEFDADLYTEFLNQRHGNLGYMPSLAKLVLNSYSDDSCFKAINALSVKDNNYHRIPAPIETSYFPAFSLYLFAIWDKLYETHSQIDLNNLFETSRLLNILRWSTSDITPWLDWLSDNDLLQLDRQTGGIMALRLKNTDHLVSKLYDGVL